MDYFINKNVDLNGFELLIDQDIFDKDIVLKSSYSFLDKGYFFFRLDDNGNIILKFTKKSGVLIDLNDIIGDFADELLAVYLRDKLEKDNKIIRESLVNAALGNLLDTKNYINLDISNSKGNTDKIDFDKDIDDILKEIEKDPDIKIDGNEIEKILKEIETDLLKDSKNK